MINSVSQLSTPILIVGGVACTTLIPAIESALRAIIAFGELFYNRCQYCYLRFTFQPIKSFTSSRHYHDIGQDFIKILTDSIKNPHLPGSCIVQPNKPTIYLKFDNKFFEFDNENFTQYSTLYRSASEDFRFLGDINENNNQIPQNFSKPIFYFLVNYLSNKSLFDDEIIISNALEQTFDVYTSASEGFKIQEEINQNNDQIFIPQNFSKPTFDLLVKYLKNKSLFDDGTINLSTLEQKDLLELMELASYLQILDLDKRCTLVIIQKIISSGSTNLSEYGNALNLEVFQKEFSKLFEDIKQFKDDYYKRKLQYEIDCLNPINIIGKLLESIQFTFIFTIATALPLIGPCATHRLLYRDHVYIDSYPNIVSLNLMYYAFHSLKLQS